ncbi:MAG: hypothetical protein JSW43_12570 [Gemmatimonadota bacterium]|nr:MAG: hypothetical protein JSW43_12570 [Gemmatimonadota bacterium]
MSAIPSAVATAATAATRARHRAFGAIAVVVTVLSAAAAPAAAQFPDAWIVPRGVLRISFEPHYVNASERFDAAGAIEPLGADFSDAAGGVRLIPTMFSPQNAIRSITGDSTYTLNTGAWQTALEADVRRFPLNLALGLSDRLTFTASIPLVSTRSQVSFAIDSTDGDQGWNQVTAEASNPAARAQVVQLLTELEAGAAFVEGRIGAGDYGCPSSAQCAQAQDLVARARRLATDLSVLTGVLADGSSGDILPPFAPSSSSAAGLAIVSAIQATSAELESLGASAVAATLPLPGARLSADDVNAMLTGATLGYDAFPLEFSKYHLKLGDAEVGLRWGAVQRPGLRAVLRGVVRLPTGQRDLANHFLDIGTGDRQIDVVLGAEGAWEPGSVLALNAEASYTVQLSDNLPRRITPHDRPIAIQATEQIVGRNLGDELRLGVYPAIRLSRAFRAYGSVFYYRKGSDGFSLDAGFTVPPGQIQTEVSDLAYQTAMTRVSVGGGIYYRSTEGRDGPKLPIEAGIDYRAAFSGSGGQTPKTTSLYLYLRLYWRLWGGRTEGATSPP